MTAIENNVIAIGTDETNNLKNEIAGLQTALQEIEQRITAFEIVIRTQLINEIIEEQELSVLYKQKQRAKKESRKEQQRRGKNYKAETLPLRPKAAPAEPAQHSADNPALRKRLYREAMVQVHPDKYALHAETVNLASEATLQLIELYQNGSITELAQYHAYIMSGTALSTPQPDIAQQAAPAAVKYLQAQVAKLKKEIEVMKNRHLHKMLEQYPDKMQYVEELKKFYADRIAKLKKRTRKMPREAADIDEC